MMKLLLIMMAVIACVPQLSDAQETPSAENIAHFEGIVFYAKNGTYQV